MAEARYQIERVLGSGGMATVYLAHDRELGRLVALKLLAENLAADAQYRARFLREARLAAGLAHLNVVQVYDVGEDERGLFIVLEYVEGETLAATLRRCGRLPPEEAVRIGIQVCAGLEQAHAAGLVHRDIKPQNILLSRDGTAKISDFGIARRLDGTGLTEHGAVLGSASYLAPEQARGEPVSAAADLYALGVVLYELLTGRPPFEADSLPALVLQREQGRIVPPREHAPGIPPALEDVVMGCLARLPEHRPDSAAALAQALAGSLSQTPAPPPTEPTSSLATEVLRSAPTKRLRNIRSNWGRMPAWRRPPRRRVTALAAALLIALAAGLGVILATGDTKPASGPTPPTAPPPQTTPATTPPQSTGTPPATTVQEPLCAELEQRKSALEQQESAINEQGHKAKDKAQREALKEEQRAIKQQQHQVDQQLKACR